SGRRRDDCSRGPPAPLARRRIRQHEGKEFRQGRRPTRTRDSREPIMKILAPITLSLFLSLPMAAHAAPASEDIGKEISREMADARVEMRAEMAKARAELKTENLELGNSLRFSDGDGRKDRTADLPEAEITPQGDLLIEGKQQQIDADQRRQLLAYRNQVIDIAL